MILKRLSLFVLVFLCLLSATTLFAGEKPISQFVDYRSGFSIEAPALGAGEKFEGQILLMNYPPENKFSDNINISVNPKEMELPEYLEKNVKEIEAGGFKVVEKTVIAKKDGYSSAVIEFTGAYQERPLHWLTRVVEANNKVYLITCTATAETFQKRKLSFLNCVESFKPLN